MIPAVLTGLACILLPAGTVLPGNGEGSDASGLVALEVHPERIELGNRFEYVQLLLGGRTGAGDLLDVTRTADIAGTPHLAVSELGLVRPLRNGAGRLELRMGDRSVAIPYTVSGMDDEVDPSFYQDVMPVISRAGCNTGSCHGSADGKNGFKLSLRGYDPPFDHAALTDELSARRFDRVVPERSLFLLKPTASVPHEGGQRLWPGSHDYETLRAWAEQGARFDVDAPRVSGIEVLPLDPTIPRPGGSQQVAVIATFADGMRRDVTAHAFIETNDIEVTRVDEGGLVTGLRRGEAAILARYEGSYASTRLFVMGERSGWEWPATPEHNFVDTLVFDKLRAIKSVPSDLCTDAEFARRLYLDLTGIPPTARETRMFLRDTRESRVKREELIDRLIGSADFVDYWTNKWCDLLQVNGKFLGPEGTRAFRTWIETCVASNEPYDSMVRQVLNSSGSTHGSPPAAYYKIQREPDVAMETTTQLFLGIRFSCNKCHDHPFERWTQRDHWRLAAWFAQVGRENVAASPMLGAGIANEEIVSDVGEGEVHYPETTEVAPPAFPFEHGGMVAEGTRRARLAAWITAAENPYFARSFANRVWSYFLGVGLIDPVDDIRAANPPTNPELLDRLTRELVDSGFDVRELMRTICRSRVYQHSVETNEWNEDDGINYSHALARRLPAEVLYDAVHRATGTRPRLPGERSGTRAVQLVDSSVTSSDGFLELFGRPPRELACECERNNGVSLGQALNLVNGPTIAEAIRAEDGDVADLVAVEEDPREIVAELYLSFLGRYPTREELDDFARTLIVTDPDNRFALDPADAAELTRRRTDWEESLPALPDWRAIAPVTAVSAGGADLVVQEDGSVRIEGELPAKDVYTLVLQTDASEVTGIRLEVLPDEELPSGGPGRAENGNFVLGELSVTAAPIPGEARRVELQNASADFSQNGYSVTAAIDGKPETGWAVSPQFGRRHVAVFETGPGTAPAGSTLLVLRLDQPYGAQHTIARLRVSVTGSQRPVRQSGLPDDVERALAVPAEHRTPEDEARVYAHFIGQHPDLSERIRLGAAQDLAWALANSPAFLFNR